MTISQLIARIEIGLRAHVLNWPWRDRQTRRNVRNKVLETAIPRYLKRYLPAAAAVPNTKPGKPNGDEKIWSIWTQGAENAPDWVRACYRSVARNCQQEHIILDEENLFKYIELPDYIMKKRASGKISNAHFADIARVELLYQYGGIWMDSTGFVTAPVPDYFLKPDFFAYLLNPESKSGWRYSFMQNCFMGARRGSYLLAAWRAMIHAYWRAENGTVDYMVHQLLFKTLVLNDPRAKIEFEKMPHMYQDPTHALWWTYRDKPFDQKIYDEITSKTWVQKTTWRDVINPVPGSFADVMMKMN
ncbi:capsular polysaccharide synthesis protein [Lachnospiraceae bacterium OttesenSCG-928-E19]|nr:capsular polysaccharide synthesis protein [Lachnospiraceae bacterium OttesenSCG-928-E19]